MKLLLLMGLLQGCLVSQSQVKPKTNRNVDGWGDIYNDEYYQLVCTYITLSHSYSTVYWSGSGYRNTCPFIDN